MKRVVKYFMLAIVACMITGCVNYNIEMNIDKSGKVELSGVYAISKSFAQTKDDLNINEEAIKSNGFIIEDYETDDYIGIKVKKTYDDINEISKDKAVAVNITELASEEFNDSQLFQIINTGLFKKTYKANFIFDISNTSDLNDEADLNDDTTFNDETRFNDDTTFNDETGFNDDTTFNDEADLNDDTTFNDETDLNDNSENDFNSDFFNNMSTNNMILSYKVTLPNEANSSNADKIEANTLTWNFTYGQAKVIEYEFDIVNTTLLYGLIGGGAIIFLAVIAIVIISIIKKSKKNKVVTQVQDVPVTPVAPAQETPVTPVAPVQETPVTPVAPVQETPVTPVAPVQETPVTSQINPVAEIMNPTGESLIKKELFEEPKAEEKITSQPLPSVEQILNQVNNSNNQN